MRQQLLFRDSNAAPDVSVPPDPAYRLALGRYAAKCAGRMLPRRSTCGRHTATRDDQFGAARGPARALLRPGAGRASRPLRPRAPCRLPRPPRVPRATRRVARCVRRRGRRVRGVLRRGRPGRSRAFLPGVSVHDHPARADHAPPPGDGDPLEAGGSAAPGRARVWVRVDSPRRFPVPARRDGHRVGRGAGQRVHGPLRFPRRAPRALAAAGGLHAGRALAGLEGGGRAGAGRTLASRAVRRGRRHRGGAGCAKKRRRRRPARGVRRPGRVPARVARPARRRGRRGPAGEEEEVPIRRRRAPRAARRRQAPQRGHLRDPRPGDRHLLDHLPGRRAAPVARPERRREVGFRNRRNRAHAAGVPRDRRARALLVAVPPGARRVRGNRRRRRVRV